MNARVVVAGAAGRTGRLIVERLRRQGNAVVAVVRRPDASAAQFRQQGVKVMERDLNGNLQDLLEHGDAVICAVGGDIHDPEYNPDWSDRAGVVALVDQAEQVGASRFVLISSMGTLYPEQAPVPFWPVLKAKRAAEARLERSQLDWIILRPGQLRDDPTQRAVQLADVIGGGTISRGLVVEVAVTLLPLTLLNRRAFEVIGQEQGPSVLEVLQAQVR